MNLYNLGSSNENRIPECKMTAVSPTILARDYKGLSNYKTGGVIECKKLL